MVEIIGTAGSLLLGACVILTGKMVNTRMDMMEIMIKENNEALAYDFKKSQEDIKKQVSSGKAKKRKAKRRRK